MDQHDSILHQIKNNQLNGATYDFVIAQLCVLNNKPYQEMKTLVDDLIETGELATNEQEQVVIYDLNKMQPKIGRQEPFAFKKGNRKSNQRGKLLEGKIQGTKANYSFFIPFDAEVDDVYLKNDNLNGAVNGDSVAIEAFKTPRGMEGRVVQILERGTERIVGKLHLNGNVAFVVSDDVKFGKDIFIPKGKTLNAEDGDKVVVNIDRYFTDNKNPEGTIVEVLGKPNNIETEVLSIIRSYNLYENFPGKVLEAAEKVPSEINKEDYKERLDLTKELLFTIDGEDARDLDDAISLTKNEQGQLVLGVHIADVGEYVKLHSVLDNEAFKRATSVYFPNLVLPMLPKKLSNGICSLNEMVDRLALTVFVTYDHAYKVVDHSIHESIIRSKKRFTYTEVDKILTGDPEALARNHSFNDTLKEMNVLAKELAKQREKRGAIDFEIPEVKIMLNEVGDVLTVKQHERNDSHRLIESFMIAANEAIAEHFYRLKMPFVYRIHEKPDEQKMQTFLAFIKQFGFKNAFYPENVKPKDLQQVMKQISDNDIKYVVSRICLRSLKKAKYDPMCMGHFGLASTFYCHFTSPIRRYPDLTIHRIIKDYLHGKLVGNKLADTKHFVGASSQTSSEREVIAERAERDVDDLYKTFYMTHHLGEEFDGRVNSVTSFGIYVELDNTVEGLVRLEDLPADQYNFNEAEFTLKGFKNKFAIGQRVKVKTIRADILAREVDFILA